MAVKAIASITLVRVDDGINGKPGTNGQNAITGYLTNESLILPANPSGVISSYSGANGYFRIMDGNAQALSGITFSLVSATGITTTINASGYFAVTAMSADVGTATYRAVYKNVTIEKIIMVVKNKQGVTGATGATGSPGTNGKDGATGQQGPATGIAEQSTVPTGPYIGMLWKNTGASGYINGVTYRWNGSKWDIFLMSVENLSVETLAAITANLGTVTAGKISGSGTNGSLSLDLSTGKISTAATRVIGQNTYTTTLDTFGGRVQSTETTAGGTEFLRGILDGANLSMGRYNTAGDLLEGTTITPKGFENSLGSTGRLIEFTSEGMRLAPSLSNTGNAANSGIELVGNISYVDFHNTTTPTDDFTARIVCNYPAYGAKRLVIQNLVEDVRIQTFGNLHVMDGQGNSYREVRASKLNPQSAHSAKKDFENIDDESLLNAVKNTEIVKYRMNYETDDDKMSIGFIINDDGQSPYETSDLFVATDGKSFDLTTSTGILIGAVKSLNKKIEKLEALL